MAKDRAADSCAAGICCGGGVSGVCAAELGDAGGEPGAGVARVWLRGYAAGFVKKNAELTRTGPYAFTRNPLYLGSMLIAFGFAVAAGRLWLGILLAAMFLLIYVPTILSEESISAGYVSGV